MAGLNELRTDKASGIIVGCIGVIMAGFAVFGLFGTLLQSFIVNTMPPIPVRKDGFDFAKTMGDMHRVWWTYLPFTIAGGVVFAVCGVLIYRGSNTARRIAQLNAILGFVWGIFYAWSCSRLVEGFFVPGLEVSESTLEMLRVVSFITNLVFDATFPAAILFLLSRPKDQTIDAIVC